MIQKKNPPTTPRRATGPSRDKTRTRTSRDKTTTVAKNTFTFRPVSIFSGSELLFSEKVANNSTVAEA